MLTAYNIIMAILLLGLMPVLVGAAICYLLRIRRSLSSFFAVGVFSMWAVAQLLIVPCIFIQISFRSASMFYMIVLLTLCVGGVAAMILSRLHRDEEEKPRLRANDRVNYILLMIFMAVLVGFIMYNTAVLQHTDADDATYVVNAVDMLRTDTMFRTMLTGEHTDNMLQFIKYLVAPWPFFGAFLSLYTGIKVTIMFHTVLPQMLILLATAVYYELGTSFFFAHPLYRPMFTVYAWLFNLLGCSSIYSAETFLMMRSWQGKAVVAGIGIPMMILVFVELYTDIEKLELYLLLALVNCSMCFMSGIGLAFSGVMTGSFALIYSIIHRKPKMLVYFAMALMPNIVYGAFYLSLS